VDWIEFVSAHGPDHFASFEFRAEDDARIRELLRGLELPGFRRKEIVGQPMTSEFRAPLQPELFDFYVDAHHHDALVANMLGTARQNIWIYTVMSVGAGQLWIEHGFGDPDAACVEAETRALDALTRSPDLALGKWSLEWGGQGYDHGVGREGSGAAALREALKLGGAT